MKMSFSWLSLNKEHCLFTAETEFDVSTGSDDSCHYDINYLSYAFHFTPRRLSQADIVIEFIQGGTQIIPQNAKY